MAEVSYLPLRLALTQAGGRTRHMPLTRVDEKIAKKIKSEKKIDSVDPIKDPGNG